MPDHQAPRLGRGCGKRHQRKLGQDAGQQRRGQRHGMRFDHAARTSLLTPAEPHQHPGHSRKAPVASGRLTPAAALAITAAPGVDQVMRMGAAPTATGPVWPDPCPGRGPAPRTSPGRAWPQGLGCMKNQRNGAGEAHQRGDKAGRDRRQGSVPGDLAQGGVAGCSDLHLGAQFHHRGWWAGSGRPRAPQALWCIAGKQLFTPGAMLATHGRDHDVTRQEVSWCPCLR